MSVVEQKDVLNQNISESFKVIPNPETKRFVIKIPKIDEQFLDDTSHVLNYKGEPTGINKGIIFHNGVDKTDQLVEGNGNGIMIINNVTKEQAIILTELEKELNQLPTNLFIKGFKNLVEECNNIGLIDKYNSNIAYMESNLRKDPNSNTYVRTNDSMNAYIAKESMIIEGANGTSILNPAYSKEINNCAAAYYKDGLSSETIEKIVQERFPNIPKSIVGHSVNEGDIILETKDGSFRKIDKDVFQETYLNMDGNKFTENDLKELTEKDTKTKSLAD